MNGKLITFEGIDKVGKSTQARRLAAWLRQAHQLQVIETREPGGTNLGENIRQLLLRSDLPMEHITETLLLFAARLENLQQRIRPALSAGYWVICDRLGDSSIAYQGGGHGVSHSLMSTLAAHVQQDTHPDLTFYLFPPVMQRSRMGRFEGADNAFYARVSASYDDLARQHSDRIHAISNHDGHGVRRSIDDIQQQIQGITRRLLPC